MRHIMKMYALKYFIKYCSRLTLYTLGLICSYNYKYKQVFNSKAKGAAIRVTPEA